MIISFCTGAMLLLLKSFSRSVETQNLRYSPKPAHLQINEPVYKQICELN